VESIKDVEPEKVTVKEAFGPDTYMASPADSLTEMCREMGQHKWGCVLVVDNHKLVGIFTWVDALQTFEHLLETRMK
jgi:acetoin utilization protein AcuB